MGDMDGTMLGLTHSISTGSSCFGLIFVMPVLSRLLKLHYLMTLSMLNGAVYWLLLSIADRESEFLVFSATNVLHVVYAPIIRTGMASAFGREKYGESLAAVATIQQTVKMVAPVFFTTIYALTEDVSMGPIGCISFVVAACLSLIGALASL